MKSAKKVAKAAAIMMLIAIHSSRDPVPVCMPRDRGLCAYRAELVSTTIRFRRCCFA
jgi:hypothetical protein